MQNFGFCLWGCEVSVGLEGGVFGGFRDDRECAQDMGKFDFGEVVEVGDDAVEFGAEFGSGNFISDSVGMAAESDFCGEVIEFGGGAD